MGGDPSGWPTPQWTPESSADMLKELGATTAILSVTAPGPQICRDKAAALLARAINEYGAQLRDQQPSQFGLFAALPSLLDTDDALEEIRYALDTLHADGVCVYTRYGNGPNYLGNALFDPVWKELDARNAIVFVHPTHAVDTNLPDPKMPQPLVDYPAETTRTALNMIITGTKRKYPNCKVILSHAGGTLALLIHRCSYMWPHMFPDGSTEAQIEDDFKSFYFDLALSQTKNILDPLLDLVPHDHILFGSDFPYAPSAGILHMAQSMREYGMNPALEEKISFHNAGALFPRLKRS